MAGIGGVHEKCRRSGGGERCGDLPRDVAGLAHAGDDHPAARGADGLDGGDERRRQVRRTSPPPARRRPSASVSSVRSAEAMCGIAAGFGFLASAALIFVSSPIHFSTCGVPCTAYADAGVISPRPRRLRRKRDRRAGPFPWPRWRGRRWYRRSGMSNHGRSLRSSTLRCTSASTADRPIRKKPLVTLTARPASGVPRACSDCFIRTPGTLAIPPPGKSGGQIEHDLDRVARRQRLIGVAAKRPGYGHAPLGNFDVGPHREFGRKARCRAKRFRFARSRSRHTACPAGCSGPPHRARRVAPRRAPLFPVAPAAALCRAIAPAARARRFSAAARAPRVWRSVPRSHV